MAAKSTSAIVPLMSKLRQNCLNLESGLAAALVVAGVMSVTSISPVWSCVELGPQPRDRNRALAAHRRQSSTVLLLVCSSQQLLLQFEIRFGGWRASCGGRDVGVGHWFPLVISLTAPLCSERSK